MAKAKKVETRDVKLSELREDPNNPRKSFGDLAELIANVKEHGVLEPLLVRPGDDGLVIVAGARRYRAAKAAKLGEVPVRIQDLTAEEALEIQLIENVQREDLHPMEEAEAYGRLRDEFGYPVEKVAERVSKTASTVYARMKLLDLIPEARKAFVEGHMVADVAVLVARRKGDRLQKAALGLVTVKNRWGDRPTVREAAAELKRLDASEEAATRRAGSAAAGERAVRTMIRRVRSYAMGRIVEAVERRQDLQPNDLRLVVAAMTSGGAPEAVLERRGLETGKQLTARAQKMSSAELRGLLVETALTAWVDEEADDANHRLKATCKAYGLDYRDIERTVRELQAKEAQKAEAEALFRK
jgi:ParB/RepB/Spo0J family partition protein